MRDMVVEGKYLNDQRLARLQVTEAPARLREMREWGLRVYEVRQMPGHSYPRNVYTSGGDMARTLGKQVRRRPIKVVEEVMATDLLLSDGRVVGAVGLDIQRGRPVVIRAGAVVLASGGAHNVFPFTTGPEDLTGDGQAMAIRAGAEMLGMEMVQSLPTILLSPPMMRGSLFIFLLGPQSGVRGWLLNRYGERFMERWDPARMERSTRDVLSVAIASEIAAGRGSPSGGVYYSTAHLPRNLVGDFARWGAKPYLHADWTAHGLDYKPVAEALMSGEGVEVAPAVHFFMGGVRIDERCQTSVPYLLAAGEVTGGLHGANRLSGNAFTQMLVQGKVAGQRAAEMARGQSIPDPDPAVSGELLCRVLEPLREQRDGISGYRGHGGCQSHRRGPCRSGPRRKISGGGAGETPSSEGRHRSAVTLQVRGSGVQPGLGGSSSGYQLRAGAGGHNAERAYKAGEPRRALQTGLPRTQQGVVEEHDLSKLGWRRQPGVWGWNRCEPERSQFPRPTKN